MRRFQAYNRPEEEPITWYPLYFTGSTWWKVLQPSTDSEKSRLELLGERENDSHSLQGRSIPHPFSNHEGDSIEQIELDTTRYKLKDNGRNRTFVSLHPGAACLVHSSRMRRRRGLFSWCSTFARGCSGGFSDGLSYGS